MKTLTVDPQLFDEVRKAAQEAAENTPLVLMPSVEIQPIVDLVQWRVMRLTLDFGQYDLLVGHDFALGHGRASTPVQAFDAVRAEAATRSGRIYRLALAPGYDDDGEYVFRRSLGRFLSESNHSDVSNEYWDAIRAAVPSPASGTDRNEKSFSLIRTGAVPL